jgi:hypothetical protein
MQRLGVKQGFTASYAGPVDTVAEFYELKSDASALECMQLWRGEKSESRFYKRNLFVVLRSSHPNREMLMDFSRALQKTL